MLEKLLLCGASLSLISYPDFFCFNDAGLVMKSHHQNVVDQEDLLLLASRCPGAAKAFSLSFNQLCAIADKHC